jgi:hypothetical protein
VRLVPTTTAGASAYYSVKYVSGTSTQFTESWAVRPSASPLRVADVRIPDPILGPMAAGGQQGSLTIDQVTGLRGELDVRPRQGNGFAPERAAVINSSGELSAVTGALSDCVRVDGTSVPCSVEEPGAGAVGYVDTETPAGSVDGLNSGFVLSQSPNPPSSLLLYRNGLLMKSGLDYTLAGNTATFAAGSLPQPGDVLMGSYRITGASAGFRDAETPSGTVNGVNATFTLSQAPSPASSLLLHRNGLLMKNGLDYTLAGGTVTFLAGAVPQNGDVLVASYRVGQ